MDLWQYRADVERVVDGDTLDLVIDLGFGVLLTGDEARVRLRGIDTAEIFGSPRGSEEYAARQQHKAFVETWVAQAERQEWPFFIETRKDDERGKYGRWLAVIIRRNDGAVLNDDLTEEFDDAVRRPEASIFAVEGLPSGPRPCFAGLSYITDLGVRRPNPALDSSPVIGRVVGHDRWPQLAFYSV